MTVVFYTLITFYFNFAAEYHIIKKYRHVNQYANKKYVLFQTIVIIKTRNSLALKICLKIIEEIHSLGYHINYFIFLILIILFQFHVEQFMIEPVLL